MLGVRQQTVSRWERGQTAPRGELLDRLRAALGLDGAATPPRRPLLEELPFNRLDAYQFEAFCGALAVRLYPDAREVLRYGVSGDTQHGIDIRVVTADGERIGIQCKKYEKFQPASFAKAVADLDRVRAGVDRCVLFLSTRASATVVEACDKLGEWTVWDSRTLSREVGNLPLEQALTLLDRFFPNMREEFLGVRTPGVWQTEEEAFPAFLPGPVCSHGFRLVGRADTLAEMTAFADGGDDGPRIAVLTGAAGQGKSRLLRELAREHDRCHGTATRVLPPGPFTPDEFEHLPTGDRLLVLLEDAHERSDDLATVVSGVLRARPRARVVIAARPYGRLVVQQALRAAAVNEHEVPRWNLSALRSEEAYALASEILGEGKEHAARVVAHTAADSPLLLVNAASAARRGDLAISALQGDANVHRLLLDVFVRSALTQSAQPDDDRALLHAVAALQPVATDVPHFQNALSAVLQLPFTRIAPRLQRLEGTGIVVRRGASVRISPDLLGDVLLAERAVHPHDGSPTEYVRLVRDSADGDALANALVNAGRIDWQGNVRGRRSGVLDPLWAVLEADFKEGDAYSRMALLSLLRKIAPFQPQRVFGLVRWALENPTTEDDRPSEADWMPGERGQAGILREVPRVLEAVAVDVDQLRGVYDLLWSLGRNDERPLNQNPDAPLRILLDLASYVPGKPLEYQEILLDALSEWLEEAVPNPANGMPLALLDPLFSNTAEHRTMEGWTLTSRRYPVRAEVVAPVRERAVGILLDQYASEDETRAVAAARTFAEVLRHQTGTFEPYNIGFLRELATRTATLRPGPLVSLAMRRSLSRTVRHGPVVARETAQKVVDALPDDAEHRLALLLHTGTYDESLVPRSEDAESLENVQNYWETLRHDTVGKLTRLPTDQVATLLVSLVQSGHRALDSHSEGVHTVLKETLTELPGLVPALLGQLPSAEDRTVRAMLPTVLHASFGQDVSHAVETCRRLVADGRSAGVWAVAQVLQEFIQELSVQEAGALELARALADHSAPAVRAGVLGMAVSMLRTSKDTALELLTSVPFGETGAVPHRLWRAFTMDRLLSWQDLTGSRRVLFLDQLTALPTLGHHTVQQFIAYLAEADARAAVGLLCARVERWEETSASERFEPLPSQWSVPLSFSGGPARLDLLRSVRDWLAQPRANAWRRELHAPELFWAVAGPADGSALGILLEPYQEGDSDLAQASARLLSKLPQNIVWDRVDFVTALLSAASRLSEDLLRRTDGSLQEAVLTGFRWGTPGQPCPEDTAISERAQRIRAGLPRGSAVDLFYKALQDSARHNIDRAIADDLDDS